jgi:hypothetical protein
LQRELFHAFKPRHSGVESSASFNQIREHPGYAINVQRQGKESIPNEILALARLTRWVASDRFNDLLKKVVEMPIFAK